MFGEDPDYPGDDAVVAPRQPKVLVVDDEVPQQQLLSSVLERDGYSVTVAVDGWAALRAISDSSPDVVILDVMLPDLNGFEICRRVRADTRTRLTPIILITGSDAGTERVEGLNAGADDILGKPIAIPELMARVGSLARMKRFTDELDSASSIFNTLATMIEARYGYSEGHCHRMANYAVTLGRALGVNDSELHTLHRGAFLHDIGMLGISDAVLQKPGPLTPDEYEKVKAHTTIGDALCGELRSLQPVRPVVRWHHERLDGSGYPDQLKDDQIPMVAQIVGVVEMYEAITTRRTYQQTLNMVDAFVLLRAQAAAGRLSQEIVEALADVLRVTGSAKQADA
jgi:putative two-component system response regulator